MSFVLKNKTAKCTVATLSVAALVFACIVLISPTSIGHSHDTGCVERRLAYDLSISGDKLELSDDNGKVLLVFNKMNA